MRGKGKQNVNMREVLLNLVAAAIVGCSSGALSVYISIRVIGNELTNLKETVVQNKTDVDKRLDKVEDIALDAFKAVHSFIKSGG